MDRSAAGSAGRMHKCTLWRSHVVPVCITHNFLPFNLCHGIRGTRMHWSTNTGLRPRALAIVRSLLQHGATQDLEVRLTAPWQGPLGAAQGLGPPVHIDAVSCWGERGKGAAAWRCGVGWTVDACGLHASGHPSNLVVAVLSFPPTPQSRPSEPLAPPRCHPCHPAHAPSPPHPAPVPSSPPQSPPTPLPDHARWRYLLAADGYTASSRLGALLAGSSAVLKSRCGGWGAAVGGGGVAIHANGVYQRWEGRGERAAHSGTQGGACVRSSPTTYRAGADFSLSRVKVRSQTQRPTPVPLNTGPPTSSGTIGC